MAKQNGIVKIRGTVDNLTFLEIKDGSQVRKKIRDVSQTEISTSPRYARLRENMAEFNRAIEAGKLLRTVANDIPANTIDKRLGTRMTRAFTHVIAADRETNGANGMLLTVT